MRASLVWRAKLVLLLLLADVGPIQASPLALSNSKGDFAVGDVCPVPMDAATNRGSIILPTPNGNEEYELILYSLNPYHEHNKVALNSSDYPGGLFNFRVTLGASMNASVARAPTAIEATSCPIGSIVEPSFAPKGSAAATADRFLGEKRIFTINQET